jgi:transcriptional regulator EpsA
MGHGALSPGEDTFQLTAEESESFLRIVKATSQITRHYELFLLLQGEIQNFISHQILLSAWGDFRNSSLTLDVVSAMPGVRTGSVNGCNCGVERMLRELHARWVANGRRKMLFNNGRVEPITRSTCDCALHKAMRDMRSVLVHGFHDERDGIDSLYVALDQSSVINGQSIERFFFQIDSLIAQIDAAFRRVAALNPDVAAANEDASLKSGNLSPREQEIMKWISGGKRNIEIAEILGISSYTVKNHMQRIFKKLGVTNRTEAVAHYRQKGLPVHAKLAVVNSMGAD